MKKYKIIVSLFVVLLMFNALKAQDILVSTAKLGQFNLKMKLSDVEKIIHQTISPKELEKCDTDYNHSIKINFENIDYEFKFLRDYVDSENAPKNYSLSSVKSSNIRLKTKSGIIIGMDKFKAMEILDKVKIAYNYSKYFKYNDTGKKTNEFIEYLCINNEKDSYILRLNIKDGKIISFELTYVEDNC